MVIPRPTWSTTASCCRRGTALGTALAAPGAQQHVLRFTAPPVAGASEPADAAVTSVPGVVLAILTADCLPVVFAAADGGGGRGPCRLAWTG